MQKHKCVKYDLMMSLFYTIEPISDTYRLSHIMNLRDNWFGGSVRDELNDFLCEAFE